MTDISDLQKRSDALTGRIASIEAYKRRHGRCDERSLRLHRAELAQVHEEIKAETRAFEAAHPNRRSTTRTRAARSVAPAAVGRATAPTTRRSRAERLDRAASIMTEDSSRLSYGAMRDLALREIEARSLPPAVQDRLDHLVRTRDGSCDGSLVARYVVVTGSAGYEELFRTMLSQPTPVLSARATAALADYQDLQLAIERRAVADEASRFAAGELRAMSDGTGSAGGYGLPYFLDPSIISTSGLAAAQLLSVSRNVVTTTNAWHGVTASTSGFTTKTEGSAAAEDDPTFTQPTVPLFMATDWMPFSIEFGMDQPGWADHAAGLFADSYAAFVSNRAAVGSGSGDPTGIFTAMQNTTTNPAHVTVTTAGTLGAVDLRAAWSVLPERYRVDPSCSWVMSPSVEDRVSALSAESQTGGLGPQDFTVDPNTGQRRLFGRPILSVADAPALTGTTGAENFCVVGAFSRFVVASRLGGFQVELVPNVPNFAAGGRPSGNRGFLATVRMGSGPVDANAFRLVANS